MDAVKFFKTVNRLCKNQRHCAECPVCKNGVSCMVKADDDSIKSIDETVSKVEQWAKDHPVKTRQSEFLRQYPNAAIGESDGILRIAPCDIEGKKIGCVNGKGCNDCRLEYWLTEVAGND
nr:MAG TPA: hypothetical protein [Bacteriophage sp.]